jgi:hypothetical protein
MPSLRNLHHSWGVTLRAHFDCSEQPLPHKLEVLLCLLDGAERRRQVQMKLNTSEASQRVAVTSQGPRIAITVREEAISSNAANPGCRRCFSRGGVGPFVRAAKRGERSPRDFVRCKDCWWGERGLRDQCIMDVKRRAVAGFERYHCRGWAAPGGRAAVVLPDGTLHLSRAASRSSRAISSRSHRAIS